MKLYSIIMGLLVSINLSAATKITVITDTGTKITSEQSIASQKKLRDTDLKETVLETAKKAVDLEWDEGARSFVGVDNNNPANYNISEMKIINSDAVFMVVVVNGFIQYFPGDDVNDRFKFTCSVDLEKYEGEADFVSEYAYCLVDDNEEIEYEN